jgi:hypothetical protein
MRYKYDEIKDILLDKVVDSHNIRN